MLRLVVTNKEKEERGAGLGTKKIRRRPFRDGWKPKIGRLIANSNADQEYPRIQGPWLSVCPSTSFRLGKVMEIPE